MTVLKASSPIGCVAIIGAGLLGASLGLALKSRHLVQHVIGVGRREESLAIAKSKGAVDSVSLVVSEAVQEADLVVISTPAALVVPVLDEIRPQLKKSAIVTDVASTKAAICQHADSTWPVPRRFVGSHPMAGSEKFGPEYAEPDFYENSVCLIETGTKIDEEAQELVTSLWCSVGTRVVPIHPEQHDLMLALSSHIPHVLAAALATGAADQQVIRDVIGNGFRDTTRIAAARPEIWRDICLTNKEAVLDGLHKLRCNLESFEQALRSEDTDTVEQFFADGKAARHTLVGDNTPDDKVSGE